MRKYLSSLLKRTFTKTILICGIPAFLACSCNSNSNSSFSQNETPSLKSNELDITWLMPVNDFTKAAMETDERINQFRKGKINLILIDENGNSLPENTKIEVRQISQEFLFGSFVSEGKFLTDPKYQEFQKYFLDIFNFATIGFYWFNKEISYENNMFDTRVSDRNINLCLEFCDKHDITVKGHPLGWNYKDPAWLNGSSAEILSVLKQYTTNRVETYKNRIKIWDAVNEAAEYNEGTRPELAPLMTKMIEETGIPEYVEEMCKTAKSTDPSNIIVMNEATHILSRLNKIESLLKSLEEKNDTPVYDVIGLQFHQGKGMLPLDRVWEVIDRIGKFTNEIHITEITLACETPEQEAMQAENIKLFYKLMFSHPKIKALTWWNLWDGNAFQKGGGLLRKDFSPKPTYDVLKHLITSEWMTTENFETGKTNSYPLEGFFGKYEVIAKLNGKSVYGKFTLSSSKENTIKVQLD